MKINLTIYDFLDRVPKKKIYAYRAIVTGPIEPGQTLSRELPWHKRATNTTEFKVKDISYLTGTGYESKKEIGQDRCVYFTCDKELDPNTEWHCEYKTELDIILDTAFKLVEKKDNNGIEREINNLINKYGQDWAERNNVKEILCERTQDIGLKSFIKGCFPRPAVKLPAAFEQAVSVGSGLDIRTSLRNAIKGMTEEQDIEKLKNQSIAYFDDKTCRSDLRKYIHAAFVEEILERDGLDAALKHYNDDLPEDTLRGLIRKFIEYGRTRELVSGGYYANLMAMAASDEEMLKISHEYAFFCLLNKCLQNVENTLTDAEQETSDEFAHISNVRQGQSDIDDYLFFAKCAISTGDADMAYGNLLTLPQYVIPNTDEYGLFAKLLKNVENPAEQCKIYKEISKKYSKSDFNILAEKIRLHGTVAEDDLKDIFDSFSQDGDFDPDKDFDIIYLTDSEKKEWCEKFQKELANKTETLDSVGRNVRMQFVVKLFIRLGQEKEASALCINYSEHLPDMYYAAYLIEDNLGNSTKAKDYLEEAVKNNVPYALWARQNKNVDSNHFVIRKINNFFVNYGITEAGFMLAEHAKKTGNIVNARNYYFDGCKKGYRKSVVEFKKLAMKIGRNKLTTAMYNFCQAGKLEKKHWLEQVYDILKGVELVPPGPIVDKEFILSCNEEELLDVYNALKNDPNADEAMIKFAEARLGEIYYIRYKLAKISQDENFCYKMFLDSAEKAALFSPYCIFPKDDKEIGNFKKNDCRDKAVEYLCKVLNCDENNPPAIVPPEYAWSAFYLADIKKNNRGSDDYITKLLRRSQIPQAEFMFSKWYEARTAGIRTFNIDGNRSFECKAELETLVAFAKMEDYNQDPNGANQAKRIEQLALASIPESNTGRKFSYYAAMQAIFDPEGFYRHIGNDVRNDLDTRINAIRVKYNI